MEKPRGDERDGEWEKTFLSTVKMVSRIKVITHLRARMGMPGRLTPVALPAVTRAPTTPSAGNLRAVGVGASTGGPNALLNVLRGLPPAFALPVLMVLHIDEPFGAAFADWLSGQIRRSVVYARDGELLSADAGRVVMAPPGRHMIVQGNRLRLTSDPERHSCRPSVDVLFESMARALGAACAGCLLTGMGRDGAAGLLEIRKAGGHTIAQDEATSVVYGMPREAALMGAAISVLPLDEIGPALRQLVGPAERPQT
jgi:two-component system chemotaxis response regulator CheB